MDQGRKLAIRQCLWFCLSLLIADAMAAAPADCSFTLRVAAFGLWRLPGSQTQENAGDQLVLIRVAEKLQWCLSWESRDTNIARRQAMLKSGEADVLIGASMTPERAQFGWFSIPYRDEAVKLYVLSSDSEHYQLLNSFTALLEADGGLLAVRDAFLGEDYARVRTMLLQQQRVDEFDTYDQGRAMLLHKRGRILIAPDTFTDFLRQQQDHEIAELKWQPFRAPIYFMFSKKSISEQRVAEFNRELAKLLERGLPAIPSPQPAQKSH